MRSMVEGAATNATPPSPLQTRTSSSKRHPSFPGTSAMLDINWIRANAAAADAALAHRRNVPFSASELIAIDDERKAIIVRLEEAQAARNAFSKQIGQAKAQKDEARAADLMAQVAHLKDIIQEGEDQRRAIEEKLRNALLQMPNLPQDDVPRGEDESDNVEYFGPNGNAATVARIRAPKPVFSFKPKEHFETGEALGMMDFEAAAKISGARFTILKSGLARMERALGQFMLDLHTNEHGYLEVQPPLLVRDTALYGTNQLPKFAEDLFAIYSDEDKIRAHLAVATAQVGLAHQWLEGDRALSTLLRTLPSMQTLRLGFLPSSTSG